MASRAGRAKRPNGVGAITVKATVRLTDPTLKAAERAAEALGVSRDYYLEKTLARAAESLDIDGRPLWWTDPVPADQEVLPLKSA